MTAPVDPFGAPDTGNGSGRDAAIKRDRWGRYLLPDPVTGEAPGAKDGWTRATTVAGAIADTYNLGRWQQRMVAKGVATTPRLYALAAATPLEDRDTLNQIAQDAMTAAGADDGASIGTALHSFTHRVDQGEPLDIVPLQWRPAVAAYRAEIRRAGLVLPTQFRECIGVNSTLRIAGTFDALALTDWPTRPDFFTVGDLKTGKDLSYGELEISIQLAIYAGFDYLYDPATGVYTHGPGKAEPMPTIDRDRALVFWLPSDQEGRCEVLPVDIARGRRFVDLALDVREARKARGLIGKVPYSPPADLSAIAEQLRAATTRADLAGIYGRWSDVFTDELIAIGRARHAELEV